MSWARRLPAALPHRRGPALVVALGVAPAPIAGGGAMAAGKPCAGSASPDDPARRRAPQGARGVSPGGRRLRPGAPAARGARRAARRAVRRRGARPAGLREISSKAAHGARRDGGSTTVRPRKRRSRRRPACWCEPRPRAARSWAKPGRWWGWCRPRAARQLLSGAVHARPLVPRRRLSRTVRDVMSRQVMCVCAGAADRRGRPADEQQGRRPRPRGPRGPAGRLPAAGTSIQTDRQLPGSRAPIT